MRDTGPDSTTRPAYMTASWSHILATMPRLWVIKISARPCVRCRSRSSFKYCAWIVRSRLVVGSSAISRRGSHDMPIAPTMRWRMPPDISCGYCLTRVSGEGMRTDLNSSRARLQAAARGAPSCTRIARGHRILQDHCDPAAAPLPHLLVGFRQQILALEHHAAADDPGGWRQHTQD